MYGSPDGNRTRISALKGPRANRCTTGPHAAARKCPRKNLRIRVEETGTVGKAASQMKCRLDSQET